MDTNPALRNQPLGVIALFLIRRGGWGVRGVLGVSAAADVGADAAFGVGSVCGGVESRVKTWLSSGWRWRALGGQWRSLPLSVAASIARSESHYTHTHTNDGPMEEQEPQNDERDTSCHCCCCCYHPSEEEEVEGGGDGKGETVGPLGTNEDFQCCNCCFCYCCRCTYIVVEETWCCLRVGLSNWRLTFGKTRLNAEKLLLREATKFLAYEDNYLKIFLSATEEHL